MKKISPKSLHISEIEFFSSIFKWSNLNLLSIVHFLSTPLKLKICFSFYSKGSCPELLHFEQFVSILNTSNSSNTAPCMEFSNVL